MVSFFANDNEFANTKSFKQLSSKFDAKIALKILKSLQKNQTTVFDFFN